MIGQRYLTDVVILSPRGALMGGPETTEFRLTLESLLADGLKKVVVDLKDVRWVNAAGIGILIETLNRLRETKGDLRLANCCGRIGHLFKLLKMDTLFQHFDSLDTALSSFA
jgi:anti-sigma B factor antagonist